MRPRWVVISAAVNRGYRHQSRHKLFRAELARRATERQHMSVVITGRDEVVGVLDGDGELIEFVRSTVFEVVDREVV